MSIGKARDRLALPVPDDMKSNPSRVLIVDSRPTIIRQAVALLARRFVDDPAGADDLPQKRVAAGVVVLARRIADGG
jgi:hypothetical protein